MRQRGLTLIELVVVVAVLAVLAAIIIPRITDVTAQAGTAASATILQGINTAEGQYEAQKGFIPSAWDGILNASGTLYSKLNPSLSGNLDAAGTAIVPGTLSATQAISLNSAGLTGLHFQDEAWTGYPSDSGRSYQTVTTSTSVAMLQLPTSSVTAANFDTYGHNVLFSDKAFSIQPYTAEWNNTFVVVGFGNESGLKRNTAQETPLFTSAKPGQYYARALVVFMVPGSSVTSTTSTGYFPAKYVGCFAPDGTCLMDNMNSFSRSQSVN
jgi:prepilin-type N-terminal cleavage/methylation domain-containing protein